MGNLTLLDCRFDAALEMLWVEIVIVWFVCYVALNKLLTYLLLKYWPLDYSFSFAEDLEDLLTCGVCQKEFLLSDILKFIQHKINRCNKENHEPSAETNFQQDDGDCKSTSTTEQNTGQLPPSDDRFSPMHPRVCDSSLPDDLLLISLSREAERREEETRTLELSGSQEDDVGRRCTYGRSALRFDASSNTVCTGVYSATVNNTASCEANASFPPAFRLILNFKYFKVYLFATEQKQDKLFVTAK